MQISCLKSELVNALSTVAKAVATKPQTPILSSIYLRAENGVLELQATNYEIGILSRIEAEVNEPGQISVPGRYLQEVIRRLPGDNVTLTYKADEHVVHIVSGQTNFTILTTNVNEFPTLQELQGNVQFKIKDNVLRELIKKTVFACSKDSSRPVFTGCYLEVDDTRVTMAATNTHRLSVKFENFDEAIGNIKVIIPSTILQELLHSLTSEVPTDVTINCTYNQISFAFDNLYMTSRLIEGVFPDYRRVIPPEFATVVTLNTTEFRAAVDRVSWISRIGDYNVVKLEFANNELHLTANSQEVGNADERIPVAIEGPDLTIAFNADYLTDVLKNITSEDCQMKLNQPLSPAAIIEKDDEDFIYIVTPVRTNH